MTFYIVKCFSVDKLEWEFSREDRRDNLKFSNGNKNIKHVGEHGISIKLKNKTINKDRQYKVTIQSEIKDDDFLNIGVCKNWGKRIYYYHKHGNIKDNGYEIKKVKEKLKFNDSLVIKDTCVAKLNNNEHVYFVSMFKNGDEIFTSYYSEENRKTLLFGIGSRIEVEVNVKGKLWLKTDDNKITF